MCVNTELIQGRLNYRRAGGLTEGSGYCLFSVLIVIVNGKKMFPYKDKSYCSYCILDRLWIPWESQFLPTPRVHVKEFTLFSMSQIASPVSHFPRPQ